MSKEAIAIVALTVTLALAAGGFLVQTGRLVERVEGQTKQIDVLTTKVEALTLDLNGTRLEMLRLMASHTEPRTSRPAPIR